MYIITDGRTKNMEPEPILEYFEPLYKWLKKQNENHPLGWRSDNVRICPEVGSNQVDDHRYLINIEI